MCLVYNILNMQYKNAGSFWTRCKKKNEINSRYASHKIDKFTNKDSTDDFDVQSFFHIF